MIPPSIHSSFLPPPTLTLLALTGTTPPVDASHSVRSKIFKLCVNIIIGLLLAIRDLDGVFIQLIYARGTAVYVTRIFKLSVKSKY